MTAPGPLHAPGRQDAAATLAARLDAGIASWAELSAALADPALLARVHAAGAALVDALVAGRALLTCGNGGSAAIASHVATELVGRCIRDRDPLPAVSLADSPSALTALGNDYGFEEVFARAVRALGRPGDVLLAMSTSGASPNVLAALAAARERGLVTVAMTGAAGTTLEGHADHLLVVPSRQTPRIQEVHLLWAHAWCEAIDELAARGGPAGA